MPSKAAAFILPFSHSLYTASILICPHFLNAKRKEIEKHRKKERMFISLAYCRENYMPRQLVYIALGEFS